MLQIPSLPSYQYPQPSYNAVKIDIHNPSVGGQATCPIQQPVMPQPQQAQPAMPLYNYPMAPVYNYPTAQIEQPYYMPQVPVKSDAVTQANAQAQAQAAAQAYQCPVCPAPVQQPAQEPLKAAAAAAAVAAAVPAQQINVNEAPKAPQPVVTAAPVADAPKAVQPVEVQAPAQVVTPQVDLNGFLARLTNPDFEVQANTMEEIANMVKDEPQRAAELLDAKIMDSLINIMNADSGKLQGPTQEQIVARQKLMEGKEISEADKKLATTITPMEQAERNKSYAMYTSAILQKLYKDEVAKLTGSVVPLTELPAAMSIVDQLKDNPNPMVRASAIEALSYVQTPEYKKDLNTLFTIAKNDQDKGVQEAATAALAKLAQI